MNAVSLCFYLFAAGHVEDGVDEVGQKVCDTLVFHDAASVEVNPVAFALVERSVGRDFQCRHSGSEWCTTPCCEQYDVASGCSQSCCGDEVVARSREQMKAVALQSFTIAEDTINGR